MAHVAARTPLPRLAPALIRAAAPALARYASSAAGGPAAAPWTQRELDFVRARLVPPTPVPPRPWATEEEARRHAAVLVPLCNVGGEAAVLFTVRSAGLRNHRSEVSFPGGMTDLQDLSSVDTALREAEEEILTPRDRVDVLGRFHAVPDKTGTIRVTPVVAMLGAVDVAAIQFNRDEVDRVFALTMRQLHDPALRGTRALPSRPGLSSPTFAGGPVEVWGLTAFILDALLQKVLPVRVDAPVLQTEREAVAAAARVSTQSAL